MITDINQLDLTKQYSYADYLTWEFEERLELIKGWIWKMSPAPLAKHQRILFKLSIQIGNYLEYKSCEAFTAPFDVRLKDTRSTQSNQPIISVVQPDIAVFCDKTKIDEKGCLGAPDWIIEILSPGNSKKEVKVKYKLYEENGVREYWIVSPEYLSVTVYDLINDAYVLRDVYFDGDTIPVGIFPSFSIDASRVFA